jgi:hypothetical protein
MVKNYLSLEQLNTVFKLPHQLCKTWGFHGGDYEDAIFWDVMPCGSRKNWHFSEEQQFLQNPHGITSQKTAFFLSHPTLSLLRLIFPEVAFYVSALLQPPTVITNEAINVVKHNLVHLLHPYGPPHLPVHSKNGMVYYNYWYTVMFVHNGESWTLLVDLDALSPYLFNLTW